MTLSCFLTLAITGCGGGGSGAASVVSDEAASAVVDSGGGESTEQPDSEDAGDSPSTDGVLCDYSNFTLNSQAYLTYTSEAQWSCAEERWLVANGIPDHEVGAFPNANNPNAISEQTVSTSFTLSPVRSELPTELGGPRGAVGYVLNGVKIDAATAGSCDDSGASCSLAGGANGSWEIEALSQSHFDFGVDFNNAHVQPTGAYHYHGMPEGFLEKLGAGSSTMTLIGWAADGFPIYARYGYSEPMNSASGLVVMQGSYQLVNTPSGNRPSVNLYALGTFSDDWEYADGSGDLDECNGRFGVTPEFPQGIYHYFATDSYPFFQRCVLGSL
ncbi:YHYH protein [Congregibacter litoralis]|uniref:YHYH protein n=1 Tax=Congregibacter litoralis TaxID=393662 RepID=UPI0002DD5DBE|nr:YHYH protein [Congregibacter litoralis]